MQQMPPILPAAELMRYMPNVALCERSLRELNVAWRLIESTAKMVCPEEAKSILPTMKSTRAGFNQLESQLVHNLIQQNLAKVMQEISLKAQVIIDIVVRNLFERTADVGFLAMDDAIRAFIQDPQRQPQEIVARLQAYRANYTVYDEIVILDTAGQVLANLDAGNHITHCSDSLVARTLASPHYVETFARSDLRPALPRALVYSHRIVAADSAADLGVLCLCFPLAGEMTRVFESLKKAGDRSVMLMLDANGNVIASSDPAHIPIGRQVPLALDESQPVVAYGGREYLARTCAARDYQGYAGPGWYGQVMVPCEMAFRQPQGDVLGHIDAAMLNGIMAHARSFSPPLHEVSSMAEAINHSLRRVVWNGKVKSAGADDKLQQLKSILQEISQTGDETNSIFKNSIHDLYATVLSARLQDLQFISRLMIDIMDRNLYERANDCRWWALTPALRRIVGDRARSAEDCRHMTQILTAINRLYTAYARLVVFDDSGHILAASDLHGDGPDLHSQRMEAQLLRKTLQLNSSQQYCVSPFEPSWLYGDRPTYIYCAAIFAPQHESHAIGGIGIVFDAEPELRNMLSASLPDLAQAFAAYTDRSGQVIASTHPEHPPGSRLPLPAGVAETANGSGNGTIALHSGQYMAIGNTTSSGYREYKQSDGYDNDVIAVVFVPIGAEQDAAAVDGMLIDSSPAAEPVYQPGHQQARVQQREFATVLIDGSVFAIPAAHVLESLLASSMLTASTLKPAVAGVLNYQHDQRGGNALVPVIDLYHLLQMDGSRRQAAQEIVLVRSGTHTLGLLVDTLHHVLEFDLRQMAPALRLWHNGNGSAANSGSYIGNLIRTSQPGQTIQVIDIEAIVSDVFGSGSAPTVTAAATITETTGATRPPLRAVLPG